MFPPVPPPPPEEATSNPFPVCRVQWSGTGRLGHSMAQTCFTEVTWCRGGYPPPGSKLYPTHGGAQSKSGGCSGLMPHSGTLLPGSGASICVLERRPGKYGTPWGVGGVSPPPGLPTPRLVLPPTGRHPYPSQPIHTPACLHLVSMLLSPTVCPSCSALSWPPAKSPPRFP